MDIDWIKLTDLMAHLAQITYEARDKVKSDPEVIESGLLMEMLNEITDVREQITELLAQKKQIDNS